MSVQPVAAHTIVLTDATGPAHQSSDSGLVRRGADAGIPVPTTEQILPALDAGTPSMFHVYPDTPHAFFADYRASYREAAAKDGWRRLLDWLKMAGVA